jgi:hypothetical protein
MKLWKNVGYLIIFILSFVELDISTVVSGADTGLATIKLTDKSIDLSQL